MYRFYGPNIFFTAFFFVFVVIIAIERIKTTFKNKYSIIDKKWITAVPIATYVSIILMGMVEYFLSIKQINYFVSCAGLIIYVCGALLRNSAIKIFKGNWNVHIDTKHIKCVIKDGPYKYLRHPYSLAVLLELIGFLLLANSYFMILSVFLIQYPLLVIRNKMEEKEMIKKFGGEYMLYKKSTIGLFPV